MTVSFDKKRVIIIIMAALICYLWSVLSKPKVTSQTQRSKCSTRSPKNPHLTLQNKDVNGHDIFIIGDVHGCLEELEELLELAKSKSKSGTILPIFVGDLANKGPHNSETIRKIREIQSYAVRGNHEEAVIKQCLARSEDPSYVLPEKYNWIKNMSSEDIEYLCELPYTISIPSKKVLVVHGGITPGIPLSEQSFTNFVTMRNLYEENGKLVPSEHRFRGEAWASYWPGPSHVYFGHDAARKLQQYPFATGLDTGCLYGFHLTGIFVDSKQLLQVKAKQTYREP